MIVKEDKIKEKLAENVRRLRKEKGWSQAKLAQKIGSHLTHVNSIETEKYIPSLKTLIQIAHLFEVSMGYLLEGGGDELEEVRIEDQAFAEKIKLLNTLDEREREIIIEVIDAMLTRKKIADLIHKEEKKPKKKKAKK